MLTVELIVICVVDPRLPPTVVTGVTEIVTAPPNQSEFTDSHLSCRRHRQRNYRKRPLFHHYPTRARVLHPRTAMFI